MTSENGLSIGQRIRQQRERLNWSQERLAESVGATKMSVRRWEHDTVLPQPYYREQLCRVFNVTSEMLFGAQETEVDTLVPPSGGGIWQVPHLRNPFFTGREEILQRIHTILSHEKTATLTQSYALSGLGGIGKTQTAIEYAYRYAPEYAAVLWVGAETYESLVSSFVTLADMLNLPEKQEQEQKRVVSAVLRWLNSHAEWLLIFDNVEDIELVKGFLPPARSGSLLLTSRRQALGLTAQTLDLEKMTPEEGMRFLLHRARLLEPGASLDQLSTEDKAIAQEIVVAMDGLPLALDQAGAYIEATQCNLRDFLHIFQTHTIHLLNKRDPHADHPTSVVKTFALVFEQLQQVNPQAAELLTMCAFLAPDAIPEELFKEGASQLGDIFVSLVADPWRFNAIFEDLLAYSLIQRSPENKTFTVHRLVQAVLKERIPEEQQRQWIACTTHIINQLFPMQDMNNFKDIEHWPWYEQLLPHAFVCTQMNVNGNTSIEELSLLKKMAIYLYVRTRYDEAERLFQSMLQKQSQIQESTVSNRAFVMHGLASTYREQGKYKEAEYFYQQAIQLWEQAVEPEELNKATSLIGLADLYRLQGRYAEAEPLYKQSLTLREQILGSEDLLVANSLNNFAILYAIRGRYAEAETMWKQVLLIKERTLGSQHPLTAGTMGNLAQVCAKQGRYEEAEALCMQALQILERAFGPEHPGVGIVLYHLAELYDKQQKYEEEEVLLKRVLLIDERVSGSESPHMIPILTRLGIFSVKQEKYKEAETFLKQAFALCEQYLVWESIDAINTLHGLALFYHAQGHIAEAERLYQRILTIWEENPDLGYSDVQDCLDDYVTFLYKTNRSEEAKSLEQRLEASKETVKG